MNYPVHEIMVLFPFLSVLRIGFLIMDAVIFDMDGVIVDSEIHWKTTEGFFLQSLIPTWSVNDQDRIIGLGVLDLYALLTNTYHLQKTEEQFLAIYQEMANEIYGQKVSLMEGCAALLYALNSKNIPVALASSSPTSWISVSSDRCIAIEDSKNGVLSAKNAGMFCIGFRNGFNEEQDLSKADIIIHNFAEFDWKMLP